MELLFESREEIIRADGNMYFFQRKPQIHPEPVLTGDTPADEAGASFYGAVLRDGGRYRMWYQAWPKNLRYDSALVGYAESDDGITWRKPVLNRVEFAGSKANNLVNLGVHTPSVFLDPTAPPSHRYRATGCIDGRYIHHYPVKETPPHGGGYYTFHSADGFHWEVDSQKWRWLWADNAFSIWHPGRKQGQVLLKRAPLVLGMTRRAYWEAALKDGQWTDWRPALIPDDYDDILARRSGHVSADYYGVGMMPAGQGTVAFIAQFRHRYPFSPCKLHGGVAGGWGEPDVTLAYQPQEYAPWFHTPGRPDFLTHGDVPWARNGWYVGANVADCGDEQRLYITATVGGHMHARPDEPAGSCIGLVRWPANRIFGYSADPKGELEILLGELDKPVELRLNYETFSGGSVRVQLFDSKPVWTLTDIEGFRADDSVPLTGDSLGAIVRWKNGSVIPPQPDVRYVVRIYAEWAKLYGWRLETRD